MRKLTERETQALERCDAGDGTDEDREIVARLMAELLDRNSCAESQKRFERGDELLHRLGLRLDPKAN